jgi:hypothetical protein
MLHHISTYPDFLSLSLLLSDLSSDGGASFADQKAKLGLSAEQGVATVYASANDAAFWVLSLSKRIWTSRDAGASYQAAVLPEVVRNVKPSPFDSTGRAALVETWSDACFNRTAPGFCKSSLWLTTDMLASAPALVTKDSQQYDWGAGGRIWVSTWETADDSKHTYQRDGTAIALRYTSDLAAPFAFTTLHQRCAGFVITAGAVWVAVVDADKPGALALMFAGKTGFDPIERLVFPSELDEGRYTIVSSDSDTLFVNVQHHDDKWGNLYVAAGNVSAGQHQFALSLARHVRYLDGTIEFARFIGMESTFIANVLEDDEMVVKNREPKKLTVITYDNGGVWHAIDAPPQAYPPCEGVFCRLHLHGIRKKRLHRDMYAPAEFGPLHTKANTIGKAMATGNVGDGLSDDDVGVFFTRDGGRVWSQVANGSHTYDFADHGALLLSAVNNAPTSLVQWSWNEGTTWTTCRAVDAPFTIQNIVADPGAVGERVLVYGTTGDGRGQLVHFDFTSLHERPCEDKDYELWTPSASVTSNCYLGVTKAYKRRMRDAECFNQQLVESVASEAVCPCTREDYACDECYVAVVGRDKSVACERDVEYAKCRSLLSNDTSFFGEAPIDCEGTWSRSRGYALVEGTRCALDKGLNLMPETVPCPPRASPFGPGYIALAVCAVLVIVGSIVASVLVYRRMSRAKALEYGQLPTDADEVDSETGRGRRRRANDAPPISSRVLDETEVAEAQPQVASAPEDWDPRAK